MRRAIILGAVASLAAVTPQANAAITLTHSAPIPCAVMCAYWDAPGAAGFNECSAPFPEGSYDKTTLKLTSTTGVVHIEAQSPIDYDSFICTDTNPPVLVQTLANTVGDPCEGLAGNNAAAVGCLESGDLTYNGLVAANGGVNEFNFILISYNWSDNGELPITITGPAVVLDDTFTAAGLPV